MLISHGCVGETWALLLACWSDIGVLLVCWSDIGVLFACC